MRSRIGPLLFLIAILISACGARLTSEQRAAGIGLIGGGGGGGGGSAVGGTGAPGPTVTGPTGATGGGGGTTGPTGATGGGGGGGGGAGAPAPAGGNGGATDKGVTGNQITIATISDISGVQPGLFKSTHQAIQAVAAYLNSQGGIYGRQIKPLLIDDQTNSGGNRAAVIDACNKAFALVGSMSAFDDGGATEVDRCGIPDITAITVNTARTRNKNTYAIFPNRPDYQITGPGVWTKEQHPNAVKKAAMLYLDAGVTRLNALQRVKAYEKVGFDFVYKQAVQVVEANYTPFVQKMKNAGVQYVDMVADYQSIIRMMNAMRQQSYTPEVRDWDSVVYDSDFIKDAQGVADGSQFFVSTALIEEAASNPEMRLYLDWLNRVAPGAVPDYFGLYAWSAGRLFGELAKQVGPKLTRTAFFAKLKGVHKWGDNGLHAEHDIGNRLSSPCFLYGRITKDKFERLYPASGFECKKGSLTKVPT